MKTIVTIPCRTIRAMAREMLRGRYWMTVLVVFCCRILGSAPGMIASALTDNEVILTIVECAAFVFEISLTLCSTKYFLSVFRGQETGIDRFTEPLYLTWKGVLMEIISYVQIFLWSLLFVIPGIICAIKHAQNFYAMIDNPELTPMESIHRSHEIMDGNKWKYVKLLLSFIGWYLLADLPAILYQYFYGPVLDMMYFSDTMTYEQFYMIMQGYLEKVRAFNASPIPMLLSLIPLLVMAYRSVALSAFYDLAAGNLIVQDGSALPGEDTVY